MWLNAKKKDVNFTMSTDGDHYLNWTSLLLDLLEIWAKDTWPQHLLENDLIWVLVVSSGKIRKFYQSTEILLFDSDDSLRYLTHSQIRSK